MQRVCHKNVVRLLEVMETDSFYYLVTELCSGGELLDLICERKYLDEEIARKYVAQLISAVFSMHLNGVVHRLVASGISIQFNSSIPPVFLCFIDKGQQDKGVRFCFFEENIRGPTLGANFASIRSTR